MKKINLIEWLSRNSHEKQSPQRFARYAVMLIMLLTLGVGQMWAATRTIYYYNPNGWNPPYCYAWQNSNTNNKNANWPGVQMTATDHKKNGKTIYKVDITNDSFDRCIFSNNGSDQTGDLSGFSNGKIYDGSNFNTTYNSSYWDAEYGSRNIYLDISNETGWKDANGYVGFHTYYSPAGATEDYKARYAATLVEGNIYVVTASTINSAYVRSFKAARWPTAGGNDWNSSNQINANTSKNKLVIPSGGWSNCNLTWGVYVPTVSSVALSYSVVPTSGSGTELDPYIVATGTSVTVTATPTSVINDSQCEMKYKWDSGSYGSTSTKTLNCSTNNTTYSTTVTCKNYISSDGGNTASATVYFKAVNTPTIGLSAPSTGVRGNSITLTATTTNASTPTIVYEYSTSSTFASSVTSIASTTSTTQSWTIPSGTSATTYYLRAKMTISSTTYYSSILTLTAYGKKTIHVKNTNGWSQLYIHAWDGSGDMTTWPGVQAEDSHGLSCTNVGGGLWWDVTITTQVSGFVLDCNGSGDSNQTADLLYSTYTDGSCLAIGTNDGKRTLSNTAVDCLTDAVVSTTSAGTIRETSATLGGNITSLGYDNVLEYGYYYSSSNSSLAGNNLTGSTKVKVGDTKTSTGTYSKSQTGLTAGTTYYFIAYAKNGNGVVYGSRQNFTTLSTYTVTVTAGAGGSASPSSVTAGQYQLSGTITASANTGYTFYNWTKTSGSGTVTFTNANAASTTLNSTSTATVRANFVDMWNVKGSWDSWAAYEPMTATGVSNTYSVTKTLAAKTEYHIKVVKRVDNNSSNDKWYGVNGGKTLTRASGSVTGLEENGGENEYITFTTDAAGDYTITYLYNASVSSMQVTVGYPTAYTMTFAPKTFLNGSSTGTTSTTGGTLTAKDQTNASLSTGDKVKNGGTATFTATKNTGYTFNGFFKNEVCTTAYAAGSGVVISDNVMTLSSIGEDKAVYAKFSENMTTVNLVASPTGKGTFTSGGGAVTSVSAGVTTHPTVTAVPASGYRVNTSATVWSESSDYITISATNEASTTITGSGTSGNSATLTATFTPIVYTITLNDNEGSGGVGSATVTFDNDNFVFASSFVAPTRTGYIFQGYYTASSMEYGEPLIDKDGNWQSDTEPYTYINEDGKWIYPDNMTLYAGWTPITYTVTYHANGGSAKDGESDPTVTNWTYDVDQYISVASTYFDAPTKYTLFSDDSKYWNDSPHGDGTDYQWVDGGVKNLTSTDGDNIDLYAQWYTRVNLMKNHEDGSVDGYTRVRYNQHVTYMSLYPSRTGYLCTGYYTSEDGGTMAFDENGDMVSGDVSGYIDDGYWIKTFASEADPVPSFYAHWSPIHYNLAFNGNDCAAYVGEATGSKASMANVEYETYVDITAGTLAREGYTFAGWSKTACATTASYVGSTTRHISSTDGDNVTLYAVWTPKTYTITFNALGGDCYTPSKTVDMGDEYGYLPTAWGSSGYEFVGWYTRPEGGTLVTEETQMVTASDHTLYAHYEKKERVYFKNTLGWESVYVTWDAEWNHGGSDKGAGASGKTQELMSHIYGTDIWYKDIPAAILSDWAYNIAFTSESMPNYEWFSKGQAVFRRDFDKKATMFVPVPNDPRKFLKNNEGGNPGTWYYSTDQIVDKDGDDETNYRYKNGYWVKYNDLQAGYDLKGSWDWETHHYIERPNIDDSVYVFTLQGLSANTTYNFKLWKEVELNSYSSVFSSSTSITSATAPDAAIFNAADGGTNASMKTTVAGDYTFKFNFSALGEVKLTVDYPFAVNDYKVVYSYTKDGAQTFSSEYIKAKANAVDTISMFIHSADSATARSLYIQKCTAISAAGVPTWNTTYSAITLPSETASGKTSGVYNFKISQDESKAATGECIGKYTGNYYIRSEAADGGWDLYKYRADNLMTFSEYSLSQTLSAPFSHYYCKYVGNSTTDITYTIATDYSPAICPVLTGDATIGMGNKTLYDGKPASVRFTYNEETNETFRAYLKSAQGDGNTRYLLIHGAEDNMIFNSAGAVIADSVGKSMYANELLFKDTENWVYELAIKAKPGAKVSIIAQYNDVDRYLVGAADAWETIISGGTSATKYDIAAVYDFKTNRLITTWIPSGTIAEEISKVDVLIERQYQGGGTTITFGKATEESEAGYISAKRVIGALKFDYDDLVGYVANWTETSRAKLMYFVSFPFDVNVSDIFGLNTEYGDAFVVQHYNSKLRAEKGFFAGDGTETFWEDMPVDTVMHANVGYVVVMDNEYMNGDIGHVWDNKKSGEHVYLYFPSANDPDDPIIINSDAKTVKLPAHECKINRTFNGGKLNHKYTDSNWNVMGVPIFQNHTGNAGVAGTPGAIFTPTKEPQDTTDYSPEFGYFYKWATDKSYTVTKADGFTFLPMHSYLVQYAGDVTFTQAAPAVVAAPRRALKNEENYKIELQVLNSNEEMLNRTYVELRENAVDSFALNEDLFMVSNKHAVNVYTFAGTYDVSANVMSIGSHTVPVGVIVNRAGTYTFTMPSNFSGSVTLIDTYTDVRTNLALGDYEVNLPKGTNDERFLLEINIHNAPTAIDGATGGSLKDGDAHKFIMNDMLYILKDGVIYDARGNRVK